ncbi:MAG: transporter [Anaerolineae bacterium]|nr:transporter [Anaerolineae bacterium]
MALDNLRLIATYVLFPVLATILGGIIATFRIPGPRLSSAIQHFAAGAVFAAVASELLPQISAEHNNLAVVLGFTAGVALMLGTKWFLERMVGRAAHGPAAAGEGAPGARTTGLVVTVAIDVLIDGLLIGVGFAAGEEVGILLTVALTLELLFLGLSVAAALAEEERPRPNIIATVAGLGVLVLLGAVFGALALSNLAGAWLATVLSFGAAALLYLVTEELLIEAHEREDTPWVTALFFVGFLAIFILH